MKGYVHVYTGNGKGKTTAALGMIVRAVGAGLRVYLGQFLKKGDTSEIRCLRKRFPDVTVEQYGSGRFLKGKIQPEDIRLAHQGLTHVRSAMLSGRYDMVIADEANGCVKAGLADVEDLLQLVREKPDHVELVFTGRAAHRRLIEAADLVTDMREVKHYLGRKVKARRGIEK